MQRINLIFQVKLKSGVIAKIVLFMVVIFIMTSYMLPAKAEQEESDQTGQSVSQLTEDKDIITAPPAIWSMNTLLDSEIPDLDYADDRIVIFHSYFGLFVYDLKTEKIVNSLDLKVIGCQKVQNGGPLKVVANADGNKVYLYPYEKDYMYVFNLAENSLEKTRPTEAEDAFDGLVSSHDALPAADRKIYLCGNKSVIFQDGSFGHLYLTGNRAPDIMYVRKEKEWQLLTEKAHPAPLLTVQDDSYYKAFSNRASESFEAFVSVYAMMFDQRDYAGICSLTKGVEYSEDVQRDWQNDHLLFLSGEEIRPEENGRSCYKIAIQNLDNMEELSGTSYLYMIHGDNGWYADGLLRQEPPASEWWNAVQDSK